jgi:glycolate oxidase
VSTTERTGAGPAFGEGPPPPGAGREAPDGAALVARLRAIVGDEHVYTQPDQLRTYESDGLLQYAVTPGAVVLPGSGEEVREVVRACHEAGVPWVARGAGSGLSGGALPVSEGVLIGLSRLRRILEVDLDN